MIRTALLLALVTAFGCGGGAVPVSGSVTRSGAPLASGYVTFEPDAASGTTGTGETTKVVDGAFTMPSRHSLVPGKYVVRIGPPLLGSGDTKVAATAFKPWESMVEVPPGGKSFAFDIPAVHR